MVGGLLATTAGPVTDLRRQSLSEEFAKAFNIRIPADLHARLKAFVDRSQATQLLPWIFYAVFAPHHPLLAGIFVGVSHASAYTSRSHAPEWCADRARVAARGVGGKEKLRLKPEIRPIAICFLDFGRL